MPARITGRILPPDNQATMASIIFQEAVVTPAPTSGVFPDGSGVSFVLVSGVLPEGVLLDPGRYDVFVRIALPHGSDGCPRDVHVGTVAVGAAAEYALADLLTG